MPDIPSSTRNPFFFRMSMQFLEPELAKAEDLVHGLLGEFLHPIDFLRRLVFQRPEPRITLPGLRRRPEGGHCNHSDKPQNASDHSCLLATILRFFAVLRVFASFAS